MSEKTMVTAEIRRTFKDKGAFKAYANVTIGDSIEIRDVRLMKGKNGYFVSYPSQQYTDKEGQIKYAAYVVPKAEYLQQAIPKAVLDAYMAGLDE